MKKAFSLIEVIFVLVILGIVASISSQIIVQVYEGYIVQNALYKTTTKTELVANQIVNRLTYAIDGTTIAKDLINPGTVEGTNWIRLEDIPAMDNNFTTVEWIGADYDSFSAGATPFWSGVANYETATINSFKTPGSQLNNANTIISNLSNGEVDLNGVAGQRPAVLFTQKAKEYRTGEKYSPVCMGLIDNNSSCIFPVARNSDDNLSFSNGVPLETIITERYKLAWSAYALVPEDLDGDGLFNLYLYYNYQPWEGELYNSVANNRKLLIRNVSVFKFTENGGVIQLKLCASEDIGQRDSTGKPIYISSCKEKAIIR
jgi:prepilin-type N-terminal cleavage/methylation domain-containing protein